MDELGRVRSSFDFSSQTADHSSLKEVIQTVEAANSNPRVGASVTDWMGKRGNREVQVGPEHGPVGALGIDWDCSG